MPDIDDMQEGLSMIGEAFITAIKSRDPALRTIIAFAVLPGSITAHGSEGASASVDFAFKVADAFMDRLDPPGVKLPPETK